MDDHLHKLRHSAAHILAQAVKRLWPGTQLAIGPPIEEGFYYDVRTETPLTEEDLPKIEAEMAKIVQADLPFAHSWMPKAEAAEFFKERGEPFKEELIRGIPEEKVSIYTDGEFVDLCEGPHVGSTGQVRAFKLLSLAGAYWRGDERNPMLTRIYGTAFHSAQELQTFLQLREEAKRRDHRKLGVRLKLFSILEEAGAGFVFYQPRGAILRQLVEDYARARHAERGYQPVITPHLLRSDIWVRSGHYEQYRKNMYVFKADGQEWGIKPMNCPGHILLYQTAVRSWREFPLRLFELGTVYRNEKSGVLHGLLRVRGFTQDDAHIFCRPKQLESELAQILEFVRGTFKDFGFSDYKVEMSTRPPEFLGDEGQWKQAEQILTAVLKNQGIPFEVSAGTGAFYGPKIDVHVKDSLGRYWQCATAQLDYVLPQRFRLRYAENDGTEAAPVMIHRALFGSLERFIGMLIEHHGGALPTWLAPVQGVVIPITRDQEPYAAEVTRLLREAGIRVELDDRRQTLQARVRDAQLMKVPYTLVVGQREAESRQVSVRALVPQEAGGPKARGSGPTEGMALGTFTERIAGEVRDKR